MTDFFSGLYSEKQVYVIANIKYFNPFPDIPRDLLVLQKSDIPRFTALFLIYANCKMI